MAAAQTVLADTEAGKAIERCGPAGCASRHLVSLDPPRVVVYTTRAPVRLPDVNGGDTAGQTKDQTTMRKIEASSHPAGEQP